MGRKGRKRGGGGGRGKGGESSQPSGNSSQQEDPTPQDVEQVTSQMAGLSTGNRGDRGRGRGRGQQRTSPSLPSPTEPTPLPQWGPRPGGVQSPQDVQSPPQWGPRSGGSQPSPQDVQSPPAWGARSGGSQPSPQDVQSPPAWGPGSGGSQPSPQDVQSPPAWGRGSGGSQPSPQDVLSPSAQGARSGGSQQYRLQKARTPLKQEDGQPEFRSPREHGRGKLIFSPQGQLRTPIQSPQTPSTSSSRASPFDFENSSIKSGSSGRSGSQRTMGSVESEKLTLSQPLKDDWLKKIPLRKRSGCEGKPIGVLTNLFELNFKGDMKFPVIHYDVKFNPDKPKFIRKLAFEAARLKYFPKNFPAFDGKVNAYSRDHLPIEDGGRMPVNVFDEERQFKRTVDVVMTKVNTIDISWIKNVTAGFKETQREQTGMQVLDIILRSAASDGAVMSGRSSFREQRTRPELGNGMELWTGLFQSAVLGWKPYVNCDVAYKPFPISQCVINTMINICPGDTLTPEIFDNNARILLGFLKGLKVAYKPPDNTSQRIYPITGFNKTPHEAYFEYSEKDGSGESMSVYDYFKKIKKYKIRYDNIPCLTVGPRNKKILLPPELCTIVPGQVTMKPLNDNQTRNMIRATACNAQIRKQNIESAMRAANFNNHPTMREFGLSVGDQFKNVPARILNPPTLQDKGPEKIRPAGGTWRGNKFWASASIDKGRWTVFPTLPGIDEQDIKKFINALRYASSVNGMAIGDYLHYPVKDQRIMRHPEKWMSELKKKNLSIIFVVVPGDALSYARVKRTAELELGIVTQCVKRDNFKRINNATAINILMKVNAKLNGINHVLSSDCKPKCLQEPFMIIGADVTHPSPDATTVPSIAAVTCSLDTTGFKYGMDVKFQSPRQEIILNLDETIYKYLQRFVKKFKTKPKRIFYFRDGVSEGQFPQVMHYEVMAIKQACEKICGPGEKYEPKLIVLIVQKRHHIRFIPVGNRTNEDIRNVKAGTVVDTEITHPSHIDFYLVSHTSIQGTARPTKYRCIWNDEGMSEDEIQKLTYYLCYMFTRCARSVSYPAPTYYAHLAAFRARYLVTGVSINLRDLEREQTRALDIRPELKLNNPMFFV